MDKRERAKALIRDEIQRHLPGVPVSMSDDYMNQRLVVHAGGVRYDIDERQVVREMIESDGRGWDAYGVTGFAALFMMAAMRHDGAPAHRIPDPKSGIRLSRNGEIVCEYIADAIGHMLPTA